MFKTLQNNNTPDAMKGKVVLQDMQNLSCDLSIEYFFIKGFRTPLLCKLLGLIDWICVSYD